MVIFLAGIWPRYPKFFETRPKLRLLPPRTEMKSVERPHRKQDSAPPHIGVQTKKNHAGISRRIHNLVNSRGENQRAVDQKRDSDEKPDGNHALQPPATRK